MPCMVMVSGILKNASTTCKISAAMLNDSVCTKHLEGNHAREKDDQSLKESARFRPPPGSDHQFSSALQNSFFIYLHNHYE